MEGLQTMAGPRQDPVTVNRSGPARSEGTFKGVTDHIAVPERKTIHAAMQPKRL